jgi:precorrin-6B methylase 2
VEQVRSTLHRLFIDAADASLRKEDEQKSRELAGLLARLSRLKKGAHLVDAAAGKASVGLIAAELLPLGSLTVIERDPARVAACASAAARLQRQVPVDVREGDVADPGLWPEAPDAVVALHACGRASDLVIERAIASRAGRVFVAPCCYDENVISRARSFAGVAGWLDAADEPLRRRMLTALVDLERTLRLEAAGFETRVEEFVAPTVTPHNLVLCGRRTLSEARMARASDRLAAL